MYNQYWYKCKVVFPVIHECCVPAVGSDFDDMVCYGKLLGEKWSVVFTYNLF